MKRIYKYRLVHSDGWRFELLPNNSNRQYVGRSGSYPTRDEAIAALNSFKRFLLGKTAIDYELLITENKSTPGGKYSGAFAFSGDDKQFFTRAYWHKNEVAAGIERILRNFGAHIRADLEIGGTKNEKA